MADIVVNQGADRVVNRHGCSPDAELLMSQLTRYKTFLLRQDDTPYVRAIKLRS
jgi:hypothetical protein